MGSEGKKQMIISVDEEQGESSESAVAAYQLALVDEREYGCRYCHKKFSNKQALGGHQNAHKVERAMEKNVHDSDLAFYDPPPRFNAPFLASYHRDFLISWTNHRPVLAPYPPPRLAARPHYTLPAHNMNVRLPNFGPGSSSAFRPLSNLQGPPGFSGFMVRPINLRNVPDLRNVPGNHHDESGLDLSLKLG